MAEKVLNKLQYSDLAIVVAIATILTLILFCKKILLSLLSILWWIIKILVQGILFPFSIISP